MILEELEDEILWDAAFARSHDVLAKLAAEVRAEYRVGKTQEFDPETLGSHAQLLSFIKPSCWINGMGVSILHGVDQRVIFRYFSNE
jgi:hypothetical protein